MFLDLICFIFNICDYGEWKLHEYKCQGSLWIECYIPDVSLNRPIHGKDCIMSNQGRQAATDMG